MVLKAPCSYLRSYMLGCESTLVQLTSSTHRHPSVVPICICAWWILAAPTVQCNSSVLSSSPSTHPHFTLSVMWASSCRFGFIGPVELSTSAFLFANLGHVPSERWRERFLAEALKFKVSRGPSGPQRT